MNEDRYKVELTPYPQKETYEKRTYNSNDSESLYSLNKALDKTNKTLDQNWSIETLLKEFRDRPHELYYRVSKLPLFEIIFIGEETGYELLTYSGFFNLSDTDRGRGDEHLNHLINPSNSEYEGISLIYLWHYDGQDSFIVADDTASYYYEGCAYSFEDLKLILSLQEKDSLLANRPPEKALIPKIEELYTDKHFFNFWLDGQVFDFKKNEIDQRFDSALKDNRELERLSDTGLFYESERIEQLSENLNDCLTYFKSNRRNILECLDYWLLTAHPILITHSMRYLEFLYKQDQKDFSDVKRAILDGDLDKIDQIEAFSLLDAKGVFDLICLCWKPIKQSEYYTSDINESILEIIITLSGETADNKLADLQTDNANFKKKNKKINDENNNLKSIRGAEILNEVMSIQNSNNISIPIGEPCISSCNPDFEGSRKPETDTKNFIIDAIELYFTNREKLPENYKKLKFWLVTHKPQELIYKITSTDPSRNLEVLYFQNKGDLEFSRTFNTALEFLKKSMN